MSNMATLKWKGTFIFEMIRVHQINEPLILVNDGFIGSFDCMIQVIWHHWSLASLCSPHKTDATGRILIFFCDFTICPCRASKKKKKNSVASPSHITKDICKSTPNLLFKILNGFGIHTAPSNLVWKFLSRYWVFFLWSLQFCMNEAELMQCCVMFSCFFAVWMFPQGHRKETAWSN